MAPSRFGLTGLAAARAVSQQPRGLHARRRRGTPCGSRPPAATISPARPPAQPSRLAISARTGTPPLADRSSWNCGTSYHHGDDLPRRRLPLRQMDGDVRPKSSALASAGRSGPKPISIRVPTGASLALLSTTGVVAVALRLEVEPHAAGDDGEEAVRRQHRAGDHPEAVAERAAGRQAQELGRHQRPIDAEQAGDLVRDRGRGRRPRRSSRRRSCRPAPAFRCRARCRRVPSAPA